VCFPLIVIYVQLIASIIVDTGWQAEKKNKNRPN
jgi:hypothetical protein